MIKRMSKEKERGGVSLWKQKRVEANKIYTSETPVYFSLPDIGLLTYDIFIGRRNENRLIL
jgi:hypothetical protein